MKKKFGIILISIIVIGLVSAATVAFGDHFSKAQSIGRLTLQKESSSAGDVLATYRGQNITHAMVQNQVAADALTATGLQADKSEKAVFDRLLMGLVLVGEAEDKGLAATQEEIDAFMSMQKENYTQSPEVKKNIDDYCTGAQITIDEYWAKLEQQAYRMLSRSNLRKQFEAEYCAEIGRTEDLNSQEYTDEMQAAYDQYCTGLLKSHETEIVYSKAIDK